jgi:hypothetical protein
MFARNIARRYRAVAYIKPLVLFNMIAILTTAASALADSPTTKPTLFVPMAQTAPRIDASANDPAWANAAKIGALSMCVGPQAKGLDPTPTEILVMWDAKFLYVRFRCQDSDIYVPHGTERNAMHSDGDVAEIFLDPVGDSRQFFELQINPAGGITTGTHLITADPVSGPDGVLNNDVITKNAWFILGWEMKGLQSAASITAVDGKPGWIADMAIPAQPLLKRTGLKKLEPMTLRGNFLRYDSDQPTDAKHKQKSIFMNWSPVVWGRPHRSPAMMGTLVLQRPGEQR